MEIAIWLLRIGFSGVMIIFAIDQLRNPRFWNEQYVPRWVHALSPFNQPNTVRVHAMLNLAIGIWLLSGFMPAAASWTAFVWWLFILPFAFRGGWRIGLRDLAICSGLAALALLSGLFY